MIGQDDQDVRFLCSFLKMKPAHHQSCVLSLVQFHSSSFTPKGVGHEGNYVVLDKTFCPTHPETNSSHLKIDGWKTILLFLDGQKMMFSRANCEF